MGRLLRVVLLAGLIAGAAGCGRDLTVTVRFDAVSGLRQGAAVVWDGAPIGEVEEVRYTPQGRFEVRARVAEAFSAALTDRARFVVSGDAGGETRLELIAPAGGGTPLADGSVVEGSTRMEVFGESVRREVDRMLGELGRLSDSEPVREFEAELDRLAEEFRKAGRDARERLKKKIIPELEQRWQELKRWLREHGRGDEIDPIERRLRELERT